AGSERSRTSFSAEAANAGSDAIAAVVSRTDRASPDTERARSDNTAATEVTACPILPASASRSAGAGEEAGSGRSAATTTRGPSTRPGLTPTPDNCISGPPRTKDLVTGD